MMKQGICFTCGEKGHISKKCPKKKNDAHLPKSNSIRIRSNPQPSTVNPQNDATTHHEMTPPVIPTISIGDDNVKPPPMYGYISINGVLSKTLFDTSGSDDFVGTHSVTTNKISMKRYENPLLIQQAIQGSKPKCNAMAIVNMKFGEWTRKSPAYVARLAGYDVIIDMSIMNDDDVIIYAKEWKIYFKQ